MSKHKSGASMREKERRRQKARLAAALRAAHQQIYWAEAALKRARAALDPEQALSPLWHRAQASAEVLEGFRNELEVTLRRFGPRPIPLN